MVTTFTIPTLNLLLGNQILDLHLNATSFYKETDAWSVTNLITNSKVYYNCNGDLIMGGYNVLASTSIGTKNQYFQRVYTNLPVHSVIRYVMKLYVIDSWDGNDSFQISFDNTVIDGLHLNHGYFPKQVCGSTGWLDINDMKIFGTTPHSGNRLTFRAISNFDQGSTDESFGFREISLAFSQGPSTSIPLCGKAATKLDPRTFTYSYQQCSCPEGQYLQGNTCVNCSTGCSSCFGPNTSDCFACTMPGYGWNGTNCAACSSGCYTCGGLINDNTCSPCQAGLIYYPEAGICLDYCDYPLKLNQGILGKTCEFPCDLGNFVNWDQTCSITCAAPSKQILSFSTYKLCTY